MVNGCFDGSRIIACGRKRQKLHAVFQFVLDRVESITEDQVLAMANYLFQPELVAVTLLGRLDGVKLTRSQLEC